MEDAEELKARIQFIALSGQITITWKPIPVRIAKLQEFKEIIEKNKWNPNHKKSLIKFWEEHMAILVAKRLEKRSPAG